MAKPERQCDTEKRTTKLEQPDWGPTSKKCQSEGPSPANPILARTRYVACCQDTIVHGSNNYVLCAPLCVP